MPFVTTLSQYKLRPTLSRTRLTILVQSGSSSKSLSGASLTVRRLFGQLLRVRKNLVSCTVLFGMTIKDSWETRNGKEEHRVIDMHALENRPKGYKEKGVVFGGIFRICAVLRKAC
ncbi:uncharacterized protein BDR25DRAFT_363826 [Lindgomyces ingoldianus]|uniref:Uncharacterized protein n=1 Tax=Lindgomyces ingoldianus TaxID=673940 RepID=A0ACB6Q905_9PLEO|nr:uncharacterized protein BDR25DRAFT_363826 [Lindgomyces ingoldianus]KAF2462607.1 hypothetical protein BDR25DRAFT_363826 [Lindgomyces ingoldianus]